MLDRCRRRRRRVRLVRRPLRPHSRADAERGALFGLHRRVRLRDDARAVRRSSGSASGSAWAASGAAAPRWCRRSWPAEHRGKALGIMQSGWAIGYALAALVGGIVQPRFGWRAVFFVGILPAFFTLWVQRRVQEPAIWTGAAREPTRCPGSSSAVRERHRHAHDRADADEHLHAVRVVGLQSVAAQLSESRAVAGRRRSRRGATTTAFVFVMQTGMWFGYVTFGFVERSRSAGRRPTSTYLLVGGGAARRST